MVPMVLMVPCQYVWDRCRYNLICTASWVLRHPHVTGPHASIHPCQHGAVMKTIVRNLTKDGENDSSNGPSVEMYLFIFLKFVR